MLDGPWDGIVIAVNDIACHWPRRLDHWVTLHVNNMAGWAKLRGEKGYPGQITFWGSAARPKPPFQTVKQWAGGSSGLLAVTVAIDKLGCERVVLCGMPYTVTPHFKESKVHQPTKVWRGADGHWRAWKRKDVLSRMTGKVRSMSGRTLELFGKPDLEWLDLGAYDESREAVA